MEAVSNPEADVKAVAKAQNRMVGPCSHCHGEQLATSALSDEEMNQGYISDPCLECGSYYGWPPPS